MRVENRVSQSKYRAIPSSGLDSSLVVVVEPDPTLRDEVCRELRMDGNEVLQLRDGGALLEYFQTAAYGPGILPDVIVAGVSRPEAKVLEACEQLHGIGSKTPVVFLTPARRPDLYESCSRAGATFVFDQPFDLEQLRSAVWALTLGS